jgi:UMF1 family MFS transporter
LTTRNKTSQKAWISYDVGNSAFATTILAAVFPQYLPSLLPEEGLSLSLFGLEWTSSAMSIWGYSVSISIFITLVFSLLLGSWADETGRRKLVLGLFAFVGAMSTIALGLLQSWQYVLIAFILSNIGFAAGNVFYNSLITCVAEEKDWDALSLKGFAWGYISGGLMLAVNLVMILKHDWFGWDSKAEGTRMSFILVGIWWLLFTVPTLRFVHEDSRIIKDTSNAVTRRLKALWKTFASLPAMPALLIFIIAYSLFNDGIQTVISMAAIFGKEALQLGEQTIIGTLLLIQFLSWPITLSMILAAQKIGNKRLLSLNLVVWVGIIIYAYFMNSAMDFWLLGVFVACVMGSSQALARSIFTRLIPAGRQAEYFSVYAFSGKVSAMLGPFLFALIRDLTGQARLAILSLAIFFILGLILIQFVSIDRPKEHNVQ